MFISFISLERGVANFENADVLLGGGGLKMLTVADMGEGGVKMAEKGLTYFMDGPKVKRMNLI